MEMKFENSPPITCGYFSMTTDQEYDKSQSSLRYFKLPSLPINLDQGIEDIKAKPDKYFEKKMDNILTYIAQNKHELVDRKKGSTLISSCEYITSRGTIKKIMGSQYGKQAGFSVLVTKYGGNLYLGPNSLKEEHEDFKDLPFWRKKLHFYGPKFEQYCLSENPGIRPDTSEPLDECVQFYCVFKRQLVGRNFLFTAETDGVDSSVPVDLKNSQAFNDLKLIELKVTANPNNPKRREVYESFFLPNLWIQSYLSGVDDMYVGLRDQFGIVCKINHFTQDTLLKMVKGKWTPVKGFEFLTKFLDVVEAKMDGIDCPKSVYEFKYDENTKKITCSKTDLNLLPDWYLDAVN